MDSGHGMRECGGETATEKPVRFLWLPSSTFSDGDIRMVLSTSLPLMKASTVADAFELRQRLPVENHNLLTRLAAIGGVTNVWLDRYWLKLHVSPWAASDASGIMSDVIEALQGRYGFGPYTMEVATSKRPERDRQNLDRMVEAAKPIIAYYFATDSPDDGEDAHRLDRRHIKALADAFAACVGDGR